MTALARSKGTPAPEDAQRLWLSSNSNSEDKVRKGKKKAAHDRPECRLGEAKRQQQIAFSDG